MKLSRLQITGAIAAGALSLATLAPMAVMAQTTTTTVDAAACSAAMDADLAASLPAMDAFNTARKSIMTKRVADMKAALALTDETARKDAMKTAMKTAMDAEKAAMKTFMEATKTQKEALRTACKGLMGGGKGMMEFHGDMMGKKGPGHRMNGFMKHGMKGPQSAGTEQNDQ